MSELKTKAVRLQRIPWDWRVEVTSPLVWGPDFWMRNIGEFRSVLVSSADEVWGFHAGFLDMKSEYLNLYDSGPGLSGSVLFLEGVQSQWMPIPNPCLPDDWFALEYWEQIPIMEKTMRDIRRGIWESDIVPWLKTLK